MWILLLVLLNASGVEVYSAPLEPSYTNYVACMKSLEQVREEMLKELPADDGNLALVCRYEDMKA